MAINPITPTTPNRSVPVTNTPTGRTPNQTRNNNGSLDRINSLTSSITPETPQQVSSPTSVVWQEFIEYKIALNPSLQSLRVQPINQHLIEENDEEDNIEETFQNTNRALNFEDDDIEINNLQNNNIKG